MANRRLMGMGNRSGNRSFSQPPFQGNVNPWQGNMSNDMSQGLMNQLSNPQQLALALTSLLQPQQQQMNNPPSLLSLNAAPAYNQDRDIGRFGNRGRSDFRRPEPYNKNNRGGGWRDQGRNRNRNLNKSGGNKTNTTPKKEEEKKKDEKKPNESVDLSTEEGEDEKKRDWKEEKNKTDEDQEMKDEPTGDEEKKNKDGKYVGIPHHLLHCFVCSKDMWDGESFQKHVRGRAHKQMLDSLEESMSITVGILRENMRLAEEKKLIELHRMKRLNKKPSRKFDHVESHCNMCDFKFLGKIMAHRKSEGHQRLKRFLHPNCHMCNKEFPSRMEWVDHRLSPEHLRELAKFMEENNKADGATVVEKEDESEFDLEPLMEEGTEQEDDFPILELDDDLHDLQNRIPAYRKTRQLAAKSLEAFTGFVCKICNTSFVSEDYAKNHLKSRKHYLKFVEAAKNKHLKQVQEEKEKAEKEKKEQEEAKKDTEEDAEGEEAEDENEEGGDNSQEAGDSEMYDPEEACTEEGEKEKEDSKQNGDDSVEVKKEENAQDDVEVKQEKEEKQVKEEPAVDEKPKATTEQPTVAGRPKRLSNTNVKNGAGPKSKKAKK